MKKTTLTKPKDGMDIYEQGPAPEDTQGEGLGPTYAPGQIQPISEPHDQNFALFGENGPNLQPTLSTGIVYPTSIRRAYDDAVMASQGQIVAQTTFADLPMVTVAESSNQGASSRYHSSFDVSGPVFQGSYAPSSTYTMLFSRIESGIPFGTNVPSRLSVASFASAATNGSYGYVLLSEPN